MVSSKAVHRVYHFSKVFDALLFVDDIFSETLPFIKTILQYTMMSVIWVAIRKAKKRAQLYFHFVQTEKANIFSHSVYFCLTVGCRKPQTNSNRKCIKLLCMLPANQMLLFPSSCKKKLKFFLKYLLYAPLLVYY